MNIINKESEGLIAVKNVQYAVRCKVVIRAGELEKEIKQVSTLFSTFCVFFCTRLLNYKKLIMNYVMFIESIFKKLWKSKICAAIFLLLFFIVAISCTRYLYFILASQICMTIGSYQSFLCSQKYFLALSVHKMCENTQSKNLS